MARVDPLGNFRFRVEIDGVQRAGFSEVSGLAAETTPIEYREGNEPAHTRKLAGLRKFANVTLKRGLATGAAGMELYQWFRAVSQGGPAGQRRRVVIVVLDEAGADQARFAVNEAWPAKYETSPLNAKGTDVAIESLELANEGIERVS